MPPDVPSHISLQSVGVYGIFFLILIREARSFANDIMSKRKNGNGNGNGKMTEAPHCGLARERSDGIARTLDQLRTDMAARNTIVSDFAPRLEATHRACLDLHEKMDEHLIDIRENTAEQARLLKTLIRAIGNGDGIK